MVDIFGSIGKLCSRQQPSVLLEAPGGTAQDTVHSTALFLSEFLLPHPILNDLRRTRWPGQRSHWHRYWCDDRHRLQDHVQAHGDTIPDMKLIIRAEPLRRHIIDA